MKLKSILAIVLLLSLAGTGFFLVKNKNGSQVQIPDLTPRAGESTPSAEFKKAQDNIVKYRALVEEHPEVTKNYIELAQIYIQEARATSRHHQYLPIAQGLLDKALSIEPQNFDANVLKASVMMTYHQFAEAKQLIEKAIAVNPYSSFAYGVLCDADVELGHYDEAVLATDKMMSLRPDLRSYARASYLRELHGDVPGAIAAMKMAADAGEYGHEDREWSLYNLGNLFLNMGKLDTAQYIFNGILEERPNYVFAMAGLASVKANKGDFAGATELLAKASQLAPEHILIELLADNYAAMGAKEGEQQMEDKALEAFDQHRQQGWEVDREYALFCANHNIHLPEALAAAKREYDRRPDNIDALDTYAWCLYKNGQAAAALPFEQKAMRLNTKNALLYYHAGMIYSGMKDKTNADRELQQALSINPYLNALSLPSAKSALAQAS